MQIYIEHDLTHELVLPINYHHIIQSVIYNGLREFPQYGSFVHDLGYSFNERQFRAFTFSLIKGKYRIDNGNIIFGEKISYEIRSPEMLFIKLLAESIMKNGIRYLDEHYDNDRVWIGDETVESDSVHIKMVSPLMVYSTDVDSGRTHFFAPWEDEFEKRINHNFMRKYFAYMGVPAEAGVRLEALKVGDRDKYVTKYKGFYVSGYFGEYKLSGERKYLDFLYQTGLGSKNAQGFGLFDIVK